MAVISRTTGDLVTGIIEFIRSIFNFLFRWF